MLMAVPWLTSIWTCVLKRASMLKVLTQKWPLVSGSSRYLPKVLTRAGDETWLGRYLLERTAEKYGMAIEWHPKPLGDTDWNGSGMHANFSNGLMRESGDQDVFTKICEEFGKEY